MEETSHLGMSRSSSVRSIGAYSTDGLTSYARNPSDAIPRRYNFSIYEIFKITANRIYYSTAYQVLYVLMILVNVILLSWMVFHWNKYPSHSWFFGMEIAVNVTLIVEVMIRMAALRGQFWKQWSNIFDVFVMGLSIFAIAADLFKDMPLDLEDIAAAFILVLRYVVQFLRLFLFIKNQRKILKATHDSQQIDFSILNPDDFAHVDEFASYDDLGVLHRTNPADG